MKWFIIVLMMGTYPDGSKDVFWYTEPSFETVENCKQYVSDNAPTIKMEMQLEFGRLPVEMVYCVREDKLNAFGVPMSA
jgi:hypothetical protein